MSNTSSKKGFYSDLSGKFRFMYKFGKLFLGKCSKKISSAIFNTNVLWILS